MRKTSIVKRGIVVGLALGLGAGCAPAADEVRGSPDVVTETEQGLITSSHVTIRGIDPGPDILADWGTNKQISAALIANHTLKLRFCAAHFPQGSQAFANLITAIGAYNGVPGVGISITDIAAAPGTTSHPDLTTFALPADAIYVDYDDVAPDVYAATVLPSASCDSASPKQCTQARIYLTDTSPAAADPLGTVDDAPSVGVFMHELGHVFGMQHINEDDDHVLMIDPNDMWFDRVTVHGHKKHAADGRGAVIHAGTLAFLRHAYAAASPGTLGTDEIVAHRNVSFVGDTFVDATGRTLTRHYEWDPAKTYEGWGTASDLVAGLNDVKLRWNPAADVGTATPGGFEPCSAPAGSLPHWFARMSETSTNTVDKLFEAVFEVTNSDAGTTWSQVATHTFDSYVPGQLDLRQIDWDQTFALPPAAFGLPATGVTTKTARKLRFRADANNSLTERNEANNEWQVNLCLYAAGSTCAAACAQ
jgi:hypothetical protein